MTTQPGGSGWRLKRKKMRAITYLKLISFDLARYKAVREMVILLRMVSFRIVNSFRKRSNPLL